MFYVTAFGFVGCSCFCFSFRDAQNLFHSVVPFCQPTGWWFPAWERWLIMGTPKNIPEIYHLIQLGSILYVTTRVRSVPFQERIPRDYIGICQIFPIFLGWTSMPTSRMFTSGIPALSYDLTQRHQHDAYVLQARLGLQLRSAPGAEKWFHSRLAHGSQKN